MLLRASGEKESMDYDLAAITDDTKTSGVPHERWLRALTEQAIRGEWDALDTTLATAAGEMGLEQAVDVLVVASAFNGITRVADATGIPLDENTAEATGEMRSAVGLNAFAYQAKLERYG
jgi:hypothetical protein